MSKKILIISQHFYPEIGSAGNRMKNIYSMLQNSDLTVNILTTDPTYPVRNLYSDKSFWDDEELNVDTGNIYRVSVRNKKYSRSILNRLFYYIEITLKMIWFIFRSQKNYDMVFATSPPIFIGIVGLIAKKRFRSKFILDIRDLWPESLKGVNVFNFPPIIYLFKQIEGKLYKSSDKILINSKGFYNYIESISPDFNRKMVYIPNSAKSEEVYPVSLSSGRDFKVIYAGNIGLAQNDKLLIDLAKELNKKHIKMTIIGYGLKRKGLLEDIKKEGLTNVDVVPPLTRNECFKLISQHQVGIVTLVNSDVFKTVLPGKIVDYMTCGVPIVASVSGFSKEIINREKVGYVSETNVTGMIDFIDYLYRNPEKRYEQGMNGQRYVREHFLWEDNINILIETINQVFNEKSLSKVGRYE
ncbi:glycosyltransferase family 4 protein [Sediminibacillus terrae]|uniref:glycosyltransferase family 4 protein n=1 Tax=Sediminibacillus terrae TaxID=1562106 RepID=UPI0012973494|nr:glycosyltransferase family 4 protein [Sediminibacillus terrae]